MRKRRDAPEQAVLSGLFPTQQTSLRLPAYWISKGRIAGNHVMQLGYPERQIDCELTHCQDHYLTAKTVEGDEFIIALRKNASHPGNSAIVRLVSPFTNITQINQTSILTWIHHPSVNHPQTPTEIMASWRNAFQFLQEGNEPHEKGLRRPQLGAIHAIAAHLSVSTDPATIVMPTGTGKTETMISVLVYCQCDTVLVIVPSDTLRTQLSHKFITLGCLPDIGILPKLICRPRVAILKKGIQSPEEARDLVTSANVLVATVDILNACADAAMTEIASACTHLFIDEAHHVAAPTWKKIKEQFLGKPILQFTATPFRRDGQHLEGNIIYNYPLSAAQRDDYFRHIRLFHVEEYEEEDCDRAIARESVRVLTEDRRQYDHLLMARVGSIERAHQILPYYQELCDGSLNPVIVHSKMPVSERAAAMRAIDTRESRAIICVDMLGEGFDLPNLKIAAIHDIHKSLAITLQFIGRFTRATRNVGDAAVVVDISDPKVESELQALYAENADWDQIIRFQSETTIGRVIAEHSLIESFRNSGTLAGQLSLWNLRPAYSATLFRTNATVWNPRNYASCIGARHTHWYAQSTSENVLVVVIAREEDIKWGKYREIKDATYELLLAHWDTDSQALYVYCSDDKFISCRSVAEAICGPETYPITGTAVCRVFSGVERPLVRNLGASKAGNISFTMYFGPNVTDGLDEIERRTSRLSNLFGWGYEAGRKVSWGCSERKGKIWASGGGTISAWRDWCIDAWRKVTDESIDEPQLIHGFLRPRLMQDRYQIAPICVQWGEHLIEEPEERVTMHFGDQCHELFEVDVELVSHNENGPLVFCLKAESITSTYELSISPTYECGYQYVHTSGPPVYIEKGRSPRRSLIEYLASDPLIFTYVDGSFSYNNILVSVPPETTLFSHDRIQALDWTGTNIRVESQGKTRRRDSIQYRVAASIINEYDIIFDDDTTGEAADIIAIRCEPGIVHLCLLHCKFSSKDTVGARVDDMYALLGQAQKCIRWKHNGYNYLANHMRHRNKRWVDSGHSRFIKGSVGDLLQLKKFAKSAEISLEVVVAQPGLSKAQVSDDILRLLAGTELYLKKTANARFSVLCSQ